jgi:hypothetical protein
MLFVKQPIDAPNGLPKGHGNHVLRIYGGDVGRQWAVTLSLYGWQDRLSNGQIALMSLLRQRGRKPMKDGRALRSEDCTCEFGSGSLGLHIQGGVENGLSEHRDACGHPEHCRCSKLPHYRRATYAATSPIIFTPSTAPAETFPTTATQSDTL